ncbi:MAG: radical SAM protein [Phycisphaeraceae bacterium]|nr:radical SAM protein [Phycisphaeraceae bacterium]
MAEPTNTIFGPVPSRRLGFSLGIDLVPYKVCSLDCVYCQIDRTTEKSLTRKDYVRIDTILDQLKARLAEGVKADVISLTGSGEPTLNAGLGNLIDGIRALTAIPIAIITNSTLLNEPEVRAQCAKADILLPSLDAVLREAYERVNRPHETLTVETLIQGLVDFRAQFSGEIWLEIFLVEGMNTDAEHLQALKHAIESIAPNRVQLNTAVRPTADSGIVRLSPERMLAIANQLGPECEIIADFSKASSTAEEAIRSEHILNLVDRHPSSMSDICACLGLSASGAQTLIETLTASGQVVSGTRDTTIYYSTPKPSPH